MDVCSLAAMASLVLALPERETSTGGGRPRPMANVAALGPWDPGTLEPWNPGGERELRAAEGGRMGYAMDVWMWT